MKFDYVSDAHIDEWVRLDHAPHKVALKMEMFVRMIIPKNPSDTLVFAGDFGAYNQQNSHFIRQLKKWYKTIFYVFGNHDYYLDSKNMRKRMKSSPNRVRLLQEELDTIEGVYRLDGTVYEVDGVRFGGADMWYDFSHGQIHEGYDEQFIYEKWWNGMKDREYQSGMLPTIEHAEKEKEKVRNLTCDVFVSHVPPIGIKYDGSYTKDIHELSYYTFNSEGLFENERPKVWVSGHIHDQVDSEVSGIKMITNPIGYPKFRFEGTPRKIKTFNM